jgi:hypothetical protein
MIRRRILTLAAVLLLMVSAPERAEAQGIFFGGGVTFPTGFYNDSGAKTGWLVTGGLNWNLSSSNAWIYGMGFYGENKHQSDGNKTNPYGGMLGFGYTLGASDKVSGYFFAGGGLAVRKFSSENLENITKSKFGFELGVGGSIPLGSRFSLWGEGTYMGVPDMSFFGLMAGFTIGLGSAN